MKVTLFIYWFLLISSFLLTIIGCESNATSDINLSSKYLQAEQVQLASPKIHSTNVLFENIQEVKIEMNVPEVEIYFTLDGTNPSKESIKYSTPLMLNKSSVVSSKAFHKEIKSSAIAKKEFVKLGPIVAIKEIQLNRSPSDDYQGGGPQCLLDREKGTGNFRSNKWMGFAGGNLEVSIQLEKKQTLSKVTCSLLSNAGAWIFMPRLIQIYQDEKLLQELDLGENIEGDPSELQFPSLSFEPTEIENLKILLE